MRPIVLTNDPVLLSFARSVLADSHIKAEIAGQYTSAIEGALGLFPCRLMVPTEHWHRARQALHAAGLGADMVPDHGV
jgi:hypothetical protein